MSTAVPFIDIEQPSTGKGAVQHVVGVPVSLNCSGRGSEATVKLPVHLRYHPSSTNDNLILSSTEIVFPQPLILVKCDDESEWGLIKGISDSELTQETTVIVPVGTTDQWQIVAGSTAVALAVAVIAVFIATVLQSKNEKMRNKED